MISKPWGPANVTIRGCRRHTYPSRPPSYAIHSLLTRAALAVYLALCVTSTTLAGTFTVELDAPPEVKPALEQNLQIHVEIADPDLTELRFRFLIRRTAEEITSILKTKGYFSPVVEQRIEKSDDRSTVYFTVRPGEPSRIVGIDLSFDGAIATPDEVNSQRKKQLQRTLSLKTGDVFQNEHWENAKKSLLKELHSQLYPAAQITDSQALVDPDARTVALRIAVDSGPVFSFGKLVVNGMKVLPPAIITSLNRIKPGDPYHQQDLIDLQGRLQRTGYFRSVFVTTPTDPANPERIPVLVNVIENTGKRIGVGIGVSTDAGIGAELRYDDNITFRPGWRSRSTLKMDQREQSVSSALYLQPIFNELQPRLDIQLKQTDIQNDKTFGSILGGRLLSPGFQSEYSLSLELRNERKETSGLFVGETTSMPVNLSWTHRTLDNPLFPRKGFIVNLQAGGAVDRAISDQQFTRLYAKTATYWPLGAQGTLILRGELGAVNATTRNNIPDDYLFRAGGSQSVRGYAYGKLGIDQNGAIVPGRYIGVASVEIAHPVADQWAMALFYDAGNVVDRWQDFSVVSGYGIGGRWKSPLGPVNIDLAYGEAAKAFHLHFSVGVTF